jgi:hypothetical protein
MKQPLTLLFAITAVVASATTSGAQDTKGYTARTLSLPDHGKGTIAMDYIAYDARTNAVWVPAINIGSVYVVDVGTGNVHEITGFAANEVEAGGRKRTQGPSGVSVGVGVVYIGDRADSSVCAVDDKTLTKGTCKKMISMPDGVVYVAPTNEVWVTTPRDKSVQILDAQTLALKQTLTFEGQPEGYAVDAKRGRFYMNYEDTDLTTAIDLTSRKTLAKWPAACGPDGPYGISLDQDAGYLYVACSTQAKVLNVGHNGEELSSIATGDGVDDLAYAPAFHLLFVGAAKDAKLTIARSDAAGKLSLVATVPTHEGARNGVVTKDGSLYLAHSGLGQLAGLIVVSPARTASTAQ